MWQQCPKGYVSEEIVEIVIAACNASIPYGWEDLLDCNCNDINSVFVGGMKMLLGFRLRRTIDKCLL